MTTEPHTPTLDIDLVITDPAWSALPLDERIARMRMAADHFELQQEAIAQATTAAHIRVTPRAN